jgi:hypothetical protein
LRRENAQLRAALEQHKSMLQAAKHAMLDDEARPAQAGMLGHAMLKACCALCRLSIRSKKCLMHSYVCANVETCHPVT